MEQKAEWVLQLPIILRTGNYLNGETIRDCAYGFKLDSLSKFKDLRSNKKQFTALQLGHFHKIHLLRLQSCSTLFLLHVISNSKANRCATSSGGQNQTECIDQDGLSKLAFKEDDKWK